MSPHANPIKLGAENLDFWSVFDSTIDTCNILKVNGATLKRQLKKEFCNNELYISD
jgi:hypothetical protein